MSIANHKQNTATTEGCAAADLPAAPSQQDAMQAVFASITAEMTAMERIETKAAENRHWSLADAMKNKRLAYDAALGFAMRGIEQAYSSAQWVKEYGKANLGVERATGHCRNCRHRFHAEDSYFPDEGDYCLAVSVDEIQFCPAWREHCLNAGLPRLEHGR